MEPDAAKLIGAGLATIALAGVGIGIGTIFDNFVAGALRNPEAAPRVFGNVLLGFALTEAGAPFALVIPFMILFRVLMDIFRRHDIGGFAKVLWIIFVIILPFLGVFIYLITQSQHMAERDMKQVQAQQAQFDTYVKSVSGGGSVRIGNRS